MEGERPSNGLLADTLGKEDRRRLPSPPVDPQLTALAGETLRESCSPLTWAGSHLLSPESAFANSNTPFRKTLSPVNPGVPSQSTFQY